MHRSTKADPRRLDNWDDLRFFLAVARTGSLSAAARALAVNHSTVFRRIGALEEGVSARLFERRARGYALTAVGERMLTIAEQVEDDILALSRTVLGADTSLRGPVRVATVDELLALIAPRLYRFYERYPDIELEVSAEPRIVSLTRREADVALRPGGRPDEPDVVGRRLCGLAAAVYASPAYIARHGQPERDHDLDEHRFVGMASSSVRVSMSRMLRELVAEPRIAFRANNMLGQLAGARAGFGLAILPCFMGDPEPGLVRVVDPDPDHVAGVWLLIHGDLRQTARVRALVDFLADVVSADADLFEGRRHCPTPE